MARREPAGASHVTGYTPDDRNRVSSVSGARHALVRGEVDESATVSVKNVMQHKHLLVTVSQASIVR